MLPSNYNHRRNATTWLPSLLDDFFGNEFMTAVPSARQFATPAVNIRETEKEYAIEVAAPGMTKDDFSIHINQDSELVISLQKKENKDNSEPKENAAKKEGTWIKREFSYASYSQSFSIPEDVNVENVGAKMENGILYINLPKKEIVESVPPTRQIEIC